MYGSEAESLTFLNDNKWNSLSQTQRLNFLTEASRIIDNYQYCGQKLVSTQEHEFPRDDQTEVPEEIEHACYHIALAIVEYGDVEKQKREIGVRSTATKSYSRMRVKYPQHLLHGVPSSEGHVIIQKYFLEPTFRTERLS